MALFDQFKTAIFPGINDEPREATAEEAGNGSDLIFRINGLIDRLNILISPKWGETSIYIDGTNGNDTNDGLTESTQIKTQDRLVRLIESKVINNKLTIVGSNIALSGIDLANVQNTSDAHLMFVRGNGNLDFIPSETSRTIALRNEPENLKISFEYITFLLSDNVAFSDLKELNIHNCSFISQGNYNGNLLFLYDVKQSKISGSVFNGNSTGNGSETLLKAFNNDYIYANNNYFYDTNSDSIYLYQCNAKFGAYNSIYSTNRDTTKGLVKITKSNLEINSGYYAPILKDFTISGGSITDLGRDSNNFKTYNFHFSTLNETVVTLIPYTQKQIIVKRLFVLDDATDTVYELLVSGQSIVKTTDENKNKTYDIRDPNNLLTSENSNKLELQIVGTANNISVQIETIEL